MTDYEISPGKQVTLHFSLRLDDGGMIDSNFDGTPATFCVGDESLLPGFERALFGLKAGDQASYRLRPEQAFGQHNPSNIQRIPRDQFAADLQLQPGLVVSFADARQTELPGTIAAVEGNMVVVDFNHPLAGREIQFDVKIIAVSPASEVATDAD